MVSLYVWILGGLLILVCLLDSSRNRYRKEPFHGGGGGGGGGETIGTSAQKDMRGMPQSLTQIGGGFGHSIAGGSGFPTRSEDPALLNTGPGGYGGTYGGGRVGVKIGAVGFDDSFMDSANGGSGVAAGHYGATAFGGGGSFGNKGGLSYGGGGHGGSSGSHGGHGGHGGTGGGPGGWGWFGGAWNGVPDSGVWRGGDGYAGWAGYGGPYNWYGFYDYALDASLLCHTDADCKARSAGPGGKYGTCNIHNGFCEDSLKYLPSTQ